MIKVSGEKKGELLLIKVEGNLDFQTHKEFEEYLGSVIEEGEKDILIDLTGLHYLSSCGLRVFLLYVRKIKKAGGKMVLFGLSDLVSDIFNITGFSNIMTICSDMDEAMKEFQS